MNAYRQYWFLTALLLSAAIYAVYAGVVSWMTEKFPEITTQTAFVFIALLFVWTFARLGHRCARMIVRNERALFALAHGDISGQSEAHEYLAQAKMLRDEGWQVGQADFSMLHQRQITFFENALTKDISSIDVVKFFMFIFAVFLAFLSIVSGVGLSISPTAIENLAPFLAGLLKALGLAYVPGLACLGSFMILHVLVSMLQVHVQHLCERFDLATYRVAIIGRGMDECLDPSEGG